MLIRVAVRAPIMMIFAMIMSFTINVKISLIFLATIPVLGFILIWLAQHVHPYFERVFNTYDRLNEVVQENLHGVRVVNPLSVRSMRIRSLEKFQKKSMWILQKQRKCWHLICLQ